LKRINKEKNVDAIYTDFAKAFGIVLRARMDKSCNQGGIRWQILTGIQRR